VTRRPTPTVAEYLPRVIDSTTDSTANTYHRYWTWMLEGFPPGERSRNGQRRFAFADRPLDEVLPSELGAGAKLVPTYAVRRAGSRGGKGATELYIAAARRLFACAVQDDYLSSNPALQVAKPRRSESRRRGLTPQQVGELWLTVATTGNDRELDVLLLRFHLETGCRREGALSLRWSDIHPYHQLVILHEKFSTDRQQPISRTLLTNLQAHTKSRLGRDPDPDDAVFRYRDGHPLTRRRYNSLFERVQQNLPWAKETNLSAHWIRHTAISWIERVSSYATAQAFAGHHGREPTLTYVKASLDEVRRALHILTGEPLPVWAATAGALPTDHDQEGFPTHPETAATEQGLSATVPEGRV
jgi:integrase/recombinase XerC